MPVRRGAVINGVAVLRLGMCSACTALWPLLSSKTCSQSPATATKRASKAKPKEVLALGAAGLTIKSVGTAPNTPATPPNTATR